MTNGRELSKKLIERFASSPEGKAALGMMDSAAADVKKVVEDLFTLTVRTTSGQGQGKVELVTEWSLDGDVDTTVTPDSERVTEKLADYHMEQFKEAVNYRVRLLEAILRMANIDVSLI